MFWIALLACVTVNSQIVPFDPGSDEQPGLDKKPGDDCGWIAIEESTTTKFLFFAATKQARQYYDQVFYCCPDVTANSEPVCREAVWLGDK